MGFSCFCRDASGFIRSLPLLTACEHSTMKLGQRFCRNKALHIPLEAMVHQDVVACPPLHCPLDVSFCLFESSFRPLSMDFMEISFSISGNPSESYGFACYSPPGARAVYLIISLLKERHQNILYPYRQYANALVFRCEIP